MRFYERSRFADVTYKSELLIRVRLEQPIAGDDVPNYFAAIDLRKPDDDEGYGSAIQYTGSDAKKTNCHGVKYGHMEVEIDENWKAWLVHAKRPYTGDGDVNYVKRDGKKIEVGPEDCKRYWDWVYQDYDEKPDSLDFSQNCFGYCFGVEDWIVSERSVAILLGLGSVQLGLPPNPSCYEGSNTKDAEFAVAVRKIDGAHGIKVTSKECTAADIDPAPVGPPPRFWILNQSWEQWRESGTYSQKSDCPDSVNLKLGKEHSELNLHLMKQRR